LKCCIEGQKLKNEISGSNILTQNSLPLQKLAPFNAFP
jgi:hypothetical protein